MYTIIYMEGLPSNVFFKNWNASVLPQCIGISIKIVCGCVLFLLPLLSLFGGQIQKLVEDKSHMRGIFLPKEMLSLF